MPMDVWIDTEGRLTRISSTFTVPDTGTGGGSISWDVTLYDFGTEVSIKIPAKKKTQSVDKLLGAFAPTVQS